MLVKLSLLSLLLQFIRQFTGCLSYTMICFDCSYVRNAPSVNGSLGNENTMVLFCVKQLSEMSEQSRYSSTPEDLYEISEVIFEHTMSYILLWSFAFDVLIAWCVGIVSNSLLSRRKTECLRGWQYACHLVLVLYCSQTLLWILKRT